MVRESMDNASKVRYIRTRPADFIQYSNNDSLHYWTILSCSHCRGCVDIVYTDTWKSDTIIETIRHLLAIAQSSHMNYSNHHLVTNSAST